MESRDRRKFDNMKRSVLKLRHFQALQYRLAIILQLIVRTTLFIRLCRELHGLSFEKKLNCLCHKRNEVLPECTEDHLFCPTRSAGRLFKVSFAQLHFLNQEDNSKIFDKETCSTIVARLKLSRTRYIPQPRSLLEL